jgi:hypothetical protein
VKFVRWKRYGFTHIVKEVGDPPRIATEPIAFGRSTGGSTVCGNWWHEFVFQGDFFERHGKGLLPPSDTDDEARPMCGLCKKHLNSAERITT